MEAAIGMFSRPIRALELGTWFGEGSTQIWLKKLLPGSSLTLVDSWKPYASEADLNEAAFNYAQMDARMLEAFLSTVLVVKKCEYERNGEININIMRGDSDDVLGGMRDGHFDFVYIDGDHKYKNSKKDIVHAKRIACDEFSIICGDDLERLPSEEYIKIAKENLDKDFLLEQGFHPGLMLAIHEEFGTVNCKNGFWWIFKRNGEFTLT
ncbi:MAG: class I SAM-dependent methyltransferase [Bacteroidales bacterium]